MDPQHQRFAARGTAETVDVIALSLGDDVDDETIIRRLGLKPEHEGAPSVAKPSSKKTAGQSSKKDKKKKRGARTTTAAAAAAAMPSHPHLSPLERKPPTNIIAAPASASASSGEGGRAGADGVRRGSRIVSSLVFVESIPSLLVCPACRRLCEDPVIASRCGHTFCRSCVSPEAGAEALTGCPVDSESISAETMFPNLALRMQIEELLVYCPNSAGSSAGAAAGEACLLHVKHKDVVAHLQECPYSVISCQHCKSPDQFLRRDLPGHLLECRNLRCPHEGLGCSFVGHGEALRGHLAECAYEKIKDFAYQMVSSVQQLQEDNAALRRILEGLLAKTPSHGPSLKASQPAALMRSSTSSGVVSNGAAAAGLSPSGRSLAVPRASTPTSASSPNLKPLLAAPSPAHMQVVWKSSILGHTDTVWALAVSPTILISCSSDLSVRIWDITSPDHQCKYLLQGHTAIVYSVALHDRMIYSGDANGIIRVWSLHSRGECIQEISAHSNSICKLLVAPDHGLLFSGSLYEVKVWDLRNFNCLQTLSGHRHWVRGMVISGGYLITGSGGAGNAISVWDMSTLALVKQFSPPRGSPSIYALVVSGKYIFSATYANTIDIWDLETGQSVDKLIGHSAAVYSLCFLSEYRLVSCSYDGTIRIWDLRTNRCIQNLIRHKTSLECIAPHPDGLQFFSASSDGTISSYGPIPGPEII